MEEILHSEFVSRGLTVNSAILRRNLTMFMRDRPTKNVGKMSGRLDASS
jgi:hypothetical protein